MNRIGTRILLFISVMLIPFILSAQIDEKKLPAPPDPPRLVNDLADILNDAQETALENKLVAYNDSTSTQIAVVTIESLDGYPIEMYSIAILRYWGIGQKEQDNGVLLLVSEGDREVRIETGSGSEAALTDALSRRIIEEQMVPQFQNGNYYNGIDQATDQMMRILAGQFYNEKSPEDKGSDWGFIIFIIILIIIFSFIRRNSGGVTFSPRGPTYWGGRGFGGFGGKGGGGGGFGGFGGGFGGGGGASGRW